MPEPVSTTIGICWLGYTALNAYARGGTAVSAEARKAQQAASAIVELADRSQALFGEKSIAISKLIALAQECHEPGWDGENAIPIDPVTVAITEAFLRALPDFLPLPELASEPDGAVSLDWIHSRTRLFSLSVGSNSRLAYAWLDGSDKGHAVTRFDGKNVPLRVLEGIRSIVGYGNPSLR